MKNLHHSLSEKIRTWMVITLMAFAQMYTHTHTHTCLRLLSLFMEKRECWTKASRFNNLFSQRLVWFMQRRMR